MKDILKKLEEIVLSCEARFKELQEERNRVADMARKVSEEASAIQAKTIELKSREKVISDKELIVKTIKEAQLKIDEANGILNRAKSQIDISNNILKDAEQKALATKLDIDRQKEKILKERTALEEDKKTYKDKIQKEIMQAVGGGKVYVVGK